MKRLLVAVLFAALPGLDGLRRGRAALSADHIPLKLDQVPGKLIWYSTGNPGIPGKDNEGNTSNAGSVVTSEGVVVFDALGTPSHGWALLQEIRSARTRRSATWSPATITPITSTDCRRSGSHRRPHRRAGALRRIQGDEEIADEKASQRLDQRRGALYPWVDGNTACAADLTFRERMTITLGDRRLTLLFAGPAHSSSDMMMMVEPDGVLFAGDIVQNGRIPFMNSDDVSTTQWLAALGELEKLDPKFIIPGHGRPSMAANRRSPLPGTILIPARHHGRGSAELDRFRCRLQPADWSKYREMPAFASNNRGNAYRISWNWSNPSSKPMSLDPRAAGMGVRRYERIGHGIRQGWPAGGAGRPSRRGGVPSESPGDPRAAAAVPRREVRRRGRGRQRTGQHVVDFARHFPGIVWWPSDLDEHHLKSIAAWRAHAGLPNIRPPLRIDLSDPDWRSRMHDGGGPANLLAVFCANVIHIAPWRVAEGLFAGAARDLRADGRLFLYGPFKRDGKHTALSNAVFDTSLRGRNAEWGVRDIGDLEKLAAASAWC